MRYLTNSEDDTRAFAEALGRKLSSGDVVLLSGDLGTGKSVMARGIASALDINCPMPSPTFVIMIPYKGRYKLYHYDLYRLGDADEFYAAGLDEYIGGDGISVIEWPEQIEFDFPDSIKISISRSSDDESRNIELFCPDWRERAFVSALANWAI